MLCCNFLFKNKNLPQKYNEPVFILLYLLKYYICEPNYRTDSCICETWRTIASRHPAYCAACIFFPTLGYHKCLSPSGKSRIVYIAGYMGMLDNVAEINVSSESVVVWTFQANSRWRLSRLCSFIFYHAALKVNSLRIACVHNFLDFMLLFILCCFRFVFLSTKVDSRLLFFFPYLLDIWD